MSAPPPRFAARAYSPVQRAAASALLALAALCILDLGAGLLLDILAPGELERVTPPFLFRRLLLAALLPSLGFLALRWLARAEVEVGEETVAIAGRWTRWEIPRASIAGATPWRLPWPGPGVAIQLRSGRTMSPALAMPDPTPLVAALGGRADHPRVVAARAARATRWLRHPLHTLILAPLVPAAIVFRLHQIIVYGGWLGEYHWYGLARWLNTLFGVWVWVAGNMLCWFAGWRLLVAVLAWPAARLTEPRARAVRWALETLALVGYYAGVALLLWSRLGA
jgi:hypothetical protein